MKMAVFLGAAKYVVGLLWHSSIWNFLMKNKEKNQAHEELGWTALPSACTEHSVDHVV